MKIYQSVLLVLASLTLSACASFSSNPHPGKLERVGVLLVQNCQQKAACEQFSLLESDMQTRIATLSGNIDASLRGQLIAVLGKSGPSDNNKIDAIVIEQTKAITEFNYQPFLSQAVADYIQQNYFCTSLWDQSYAWRLDDRQPVLIATLSHPFEPGSGTLLLEYDGLNKALLSDNRMPSDANPCQIR